MADNDQYRIRIGGTATNAGYVEIATSDDGTEPIYVRQYTQVGGVAFTTLTRTATLLDGSGNTSFPGTVTIAGSLALSASTNAYVSYANAPDSALPWSQGPTFQGQTGWAFYSAVLGSYRMGFRGNSAGTTRYMWCADSALIGSQPTDAEVTNTLNVMGTGRFTSTVTAPTFSGALSGNATTASNVSGTGAAQVGYLMVTNNGIGYTGATIGGGANNLIGFRWANPVVNCTVDNVISAEAANFSDRRLKTNIVTYTGGLDAARNLRPVTFNPLDIMSFTDDGEPIIGDNDPYDEMVGFIADEVQSVIPSAISGTGNQLKSVSVLQVLSVAVSAIKELDAKVTSLVARIKTLENK